MSLSNSTSPSVTPEDHCRAWRCQREHIFSEPTNLTFSYPKAFAQHTHIIQVEALICSTPYQYRFTSTAWTDMTCIKLLKKAGVYDINKIWTIVLLLQ